MNFYNRLKTTTAIISIILAGTATAQVGRPFIHDPSTIMECEG